MGAGDTVVDVACGPGSSALQLALETGCDVIGIDLSPPQEPPSDPRARFLTGDAEALPLAEASVDGALCTFPDKPTAAAELVGEACRALDLGLLGYGVVIARRPSGGAVRRAA